MYLRHLLSAPAIYWQIFPFIALDISIELYHQTCFRLYDIPLVNRSEYIRIDRYKLQYLNWQDKINCAYCGYCNGLLNYATEIAARTEKYWCGIRHQKYGNFQEPKHHKDFIDYGDEQALIKEYQDTRPVEDEEFRQIHTN